MRVFIGLHAAIAAAAEAMILPELEPQPKLAELADGILQARAAFPDSSYVVILSENLWPGGVHELSKNLSKATGVTCHPCPLGHIQRGGRPNAQDRILAMQLGACRSRCDFKRQNCYDDRSRTGTCGSYTAACLTFETRQAVGCAFGGSYNLACKA